MTETIRLILTKFTDETITIFSILLVFMASVIAALWFYNRKRFHELSHQIPASVVKNYLDSIIQNSNALKSSLFRGGGLDIGSGIPSVVPVSDLPSSGAISIGGEELNVKNAEIASLGQKLTDARRQISDLEKRLSDVSGGKSASSAEVDSLKGQLSAKEAEIATLKKSAGGDAALQQELTVITRERDDLRERLKEYEIIEEDLANLKRLQQENEQLKNEISKLKTGAPAPVAAPAAAPTPAPVVEEEVDLEAEMAKAIADSMKPAPAAAKAADVPDDIPLNEGEQKSAEELLSEFERMLG